MGFQSVGGGFLIKDGSGNTKFDSTLQNYLETNYLSGSFSIPRRDAENNAIDTSATHTLGGCHSSATIVLGAAKIVRAEPFASGLLEISPTDSWNAVGGTLIIGAGRSNALAPAFRQNDDGEALAGAQTLTFYATGGTVYAKEVVLMREILSVSIQQYSFVGTPAWTVYYKLSIGLFDR